MGELRPTPPHLLVVAVFSRHPDALTWARTRLEADFGPVALASEPFVFNQTSYYLPEMGPALRKQSLFSRELVPADSLPSLKLRTNALEQELASTRTYPETRPLNLDPGLLQL